MAKFTPAEDVLEHHDGVVDEHPDPEGDSSQGHDVQGEPVEIHQDERGDDRYRDGSPDDKRAPDIAQEEQKDDDRENASLDGRIGDVRDRLPDVFRGIHDGCEMQLGKVPVDPPDLLGHPVRDLDGILSRLFLNAQPDSGLAVHPDDRTDLFPAIVDFGDFSQPDDRIPILFHDHVPELFNLVELPRGADDEFVVPRLNEPGGEAEILGFQTGDDSLNLQSKGFQPAQLQVDMNLSLPATLDVEGCHPGNPFYPVFYLVLDQLEHLNRVEIAGSSDDHDRGR